MSDFKDIYGHEATKRAIEVAITARINLIIIGRNGNGFGMLKNAFNEMNKTIDNRLGVSFISFYDPNDDNDKFIGFEKEVFNNNGVMCVMMSDFNQLVSYKELEGNNIVEKRIRDARDLMHIDLMPSFADFINNPLLKNSFQKLKLTYSNVNTIRKVAYAISKLDKSNNIDMNHVAESINYCPRIITKDMLERYLHPML